MPKTKGTFKIIRFYRDYRESQILQRGVTEAEARAHCAKPESKNYAENWFDGWRPED